MQDSLKVENTPTRHRRQHSVSGTIQASFLAKFKTNQNKLRQKRHHHRPQCIYDIYIYIDIQIYIYIYIYKTIYIYIYIIYIYIYIYIYHISVCVCVYVYTYIICMVNVLGRKSPKTQCLPTSFAREELGNLLQYIILVENLLYF